MLANAGKQDQMLLATDVLAKRLCQIRKLRQARGQDANPTVDDIARTHMVFTHSQFKPMCALTFEYSKQQSAQGANAFGADITFNINQFGEFFSDIALHVELEGPSTSTVTGIDLLPVSDRPLYRWADWLGDRLVAHASFSIATNLLDDYTRDEAVMKRELFVPPWKLEAWKRCLGQESSVEGTYVQPNWVGSGVAPSEIQHRMVGAVRTGLQTPKGIPEVAEKVDLVIPLRFWFCSDVSQAVSSVAIPSNQRMLTVKLANMNEVCELVPRGTKTWADPGVQLGSQSVQLKRVELYINNLFVSPEVHDVYLNRLGFSLVRVHRRQVSHVSSGSGEFQLNQLKWPLEWLAISTKLTKNVNPSTNEERRKALSTWHRHDAATTRQYSTALSGAHRARRVVNTDGTPTLVQSITAGVVAFDGTVAAGQIVPGDTVEVRGVRFVVASVAAGVPTLQDTSVTVAYSNVAPLVRPHMLVVSSVNESAPVSSDVLEVFDSSSLLSSIALKAHNINLYHGFGSSFYNSYLPSRYGKCLNAPADKGLLFVPFCQTPGEFQPSGHINISRAREFYLEYASETISNSNPAVISIMASAFNFLLISDGSATLRYST